MNVEEEIQLYPVLLALRALAYESVIWDKNLNTFLNSSQRQKYTWWEYAKQSDLPMYQTLKLKVIEIRMNQ